MKWRILHVIDHTESGGAQEVVRYLIRSLRDHFLFDVAVLGRSGCFSQAYRNMGIPVYTIGNQRGRWSPLAVLGLIQLIRHKRHDLIHTHLFKSNILGTLAAWWTGHRTVLHDHSGIYSPSLKHRYYFSNRFLRRSYLLAYRHVQRHADHIVVLTQDALLHYRQLYFTKRSKITVLPNTVDLPRFSQAKKRQPAGNIRAELDLSPQTKLVIMIGRLEPEKDWWTFVRVAQEVHQRVSYPCAFLVVGSGSQGPMLHSHVRDKNIGQVFFLGYREDVLNLLHQADVFLLTSRYERFGIVILEAMATGCPVVATRSGGPESIITSGVDGLLAEAGDVKGLSDNVICLLDENSLRRKLVKNARLTVSHCYSIEEISERMAGIYENVLAR